ncbi:MAG: hypothetical protein K6E99_02970, partial [Bacilli bacterium]|nr:hypothetical protein [Bacilli bacterium]
NNKNKLITKKELIYALVVLVFIYIIYLYGMSLDSNKRKNTNSYNDSTTSVNKNDPNTLTDEQVDALSKLKIAYDNSLNNGFDIIHGETCKNISGIFGNKGFTCGQYPLEVNYISDNQLTIYKDYNCYSLTINGNSILSSNVENLMMTGNTTCKGIHIGYINIDEKNDYCNKIGGFNQIKEMAIYTYNNNKSPYAYYDYNHIKERGGIPNLYSTYFIFVNQYMCGVTGKGNSGCGFVGKEESNKMCEYYYYIMK